VQRVLSISVESGSSIAVWAAYFANAHIKGVDIQSQTWRFDLFDLNSLRIQLLELDATLPSASREIVRKGSPRLYDIILEDASHLPDHQVQHLAVFAASLAPCSIYIVEDIHEHYAHRVRHELAQISTLHSLRMELYDLRNSKGRFDNILAVCYRER